ncbi:hypothetical protein CLOP_g12521 [Closterium sp. NIES-67]|nr:hypothetical protein CLOP_g12521 [Closterium sp. NIES-67]
MALTSALPAMSSLHIMSTQSPNLATSIAPFPITPSLPLATHSSTNDSRQLITFRILRPTSCRSPHFPRLTARTSLCNRACVVARASRDSSSGRDSESQSRVSEGEEEEDEEEAEVEKCHFGGKELERFVRINEGQWRGVFLHYDLNGRLLHRVPTRMSATAFGKGENSSLLQTLSVKQGGTGGDGEEEEWVEIKLEEVNRITAANRLQVGWFPDQSAYSVCHQTAETLVKVLTVGVLGEEAAEADEAAEVIRGLRLPSRRPALVSETCLFLSEPDSEPPSEASPEASAEAEESRPKQRVRSFHVLNSRGMIDTLGVFVEERERSGEGASEDASPQVRELLEAQPDVPNAPVPLSRLSLLLGEWDGSSITHRSAIYGETVTRSTSNFFLTRFEDGSLGLEETRGDVCFRRRGAVANHTDDSPETAGIGSTQQQQEQQEHEQEQQEHEQQQQEHEQQQQVGGRVLLDGGQQITLLPGGLSLSAPCCVPRGRAFFFETVLAEPVAGEGLEMPQGGEGWQRRRVVRTYDPDGMVVSSSVFAERKTV